ncbi:hypothetical protein OIP63_20730 [Kitasatospora purpeofusca]|nr:hypothetical protein OIP63_20730 [Kitasatospora purpeofusca]
MKMEVDAVAVAPEGGGIVFEIVTRGLPGASKHKLQAIENLRREVQKSSGWDLEVIVLSDPGVEVNPSDIEKRLESAIQMAQSGADSNNEYFVSSGFMLAFSALELTLAKWCQDLKIKYSPNASAMATLLVSEGHLSDITYHEIRKAQGVRNNLAHGREAPSAVALDSVVNLEALVRRVSGELQSASLEQ